MSRLPVQDSVESTDLPDIKVYTRRWYILGLFGLLACHQVTSCSLRIPVPSKVILPVRGVEHLRADRERRAVRLRLVRLRGADARQLGLHHVRADLGAADQAGRGDHHHHQW